MPLGQSTRVDRMLRPVHRWVWGDFDRRVRKLLAFAEVEGDGGRDILRAAEVTSDPLLRRLYLEHAIDELRHADLFRQRGATLLQLRSTRSEGLFHMNYTYTQLARVLPKSYRRQVWRARASRLWKRYLRVAAAVAGVLSTAILTIMYFVFLAPFAWLARRAERREPVGWTPIVHDSHDSPTSQY